MPAFTRTQRLRRTAIPMQLRNWGALPERAERSLTHDVQSAAGGGVMLAFASFSDCKPAINAVFPTESVSTAVTVVQAAWEEIDWYRSRY